MSSPFSGAPGRKASIAQGMILDQGKKEAFGFLDQGQTDSLASLGRGFGEARGLTSQGYQGALSSLGTGYTNAHTFLNDAYTGYDPLMGSAMGGYNLYGDATGANGDAGSARARSAFQTGPGYQFAVDQGTQQALRAANAAGMTASGNTLTGITDRANNMANQEYGNWISRLAPYLSLAPQLVGARADIRGKQAALEDSYGRARGDLYTGETGALSNLATGLGTAEAGIYGNVAGNKANTAIGVADKLGDVVNKGMMAGQEAAATRMNFGLGALGTGLNLLSLGTGGGNTIGGSLMKGLFK